MYTLCGKFYRLTMGVTWSCSRWLWLNGRSVLVKVRFMLVLNKQLCLYSGLSCFNDNENDESQSRNIIAKSKTIHIIMYIRKSRSSIESWLVKRYLYWRVHSPILRWDTIRWRVEQNKTNGFKIWWANRSDHCLFSSQVNSAIMIADQFGILNVVWIWPTQYYTDLSEWTILCWITFRCECKLILSNDNICEQVFCVVDDKFVIYLKRLLKSPVNTLCCVKKKKYIMKRKISLCLSCWLKIRKQKIHI